MEPDKIDALMNCLANKQRREVMYALLDEDEVVINDTYEPGKKVALAHDHLPRLEEAEVIEYDKSEDEYVIQCGEEWNEIEDMIEFISRKSNRM